MQTLNFYIFRPLLVAAGLSLLTGCTSVFSDVKTTWNYATADRTGATLSDAERAAFPYTALYVNRADAPRALVVLGYIDGDGPGSAYSWVTGDSETLVTRSGRLVGTDGLVPDLVATSNLSADPLLCFQQRQQLSAECLSSWNSVRDITTENKNYSVAASSWFEMGGRETISLPAGDVEVRKVTETLSFAESAAGPAQEVTNYFWLENDGHVVKSVQHWAPHQDPLQLVQVKWVGRGNE